MKNRFALLGGALIAAALLSTPSLAQTKKKAPAAPAAAAAPQKQDQEYTKLIKQYLQDPRFSTELVDHMPASDTVPSPLKFLGRIPGTPGEIDYAKDIHRYYEALAKASPRAKFWKIGQSEEGRDMVLLAIADDATIRDLDKYKAMLAQLADPRKITEAQAQQLIHTAKPIYWITAGIHSRELGGPECVIELAYRLIVEETPFIQHIRNNAIVLITPVIEVDGRERYADTYYFNKKLPAGSPQLPLTWWGKYVSHDDNRDNMGQMLKLSQNVTRAYLDWHPTILHDLHEAQAYLYASTGTGPYNSSLDPIVTNEWFLLAETEVMEMAKRGVPGVFTWGYYDGYPPNYMFWLANIHNSIGRFYEVMTYGPDINPNLTQPPTATSREWYRMNPPLPTVAWGPRNNTNIQESALLLALHRVATDREMYLGNFYAKNKRAIEFGKTGFDAAHYSVPNAWVIPAAQRRKANTADLVNDLRKQGLEFHRATNSFKVGNIEVAAGDYIVRADQPYRTLADCYFDVQNYPPANPAPHDDTGWTMQYERDVTLKPVRDKSILDQPMTLITADVKAPGGVEGSGSTLVVEHAGDNNLVFFRYRNKDVRMLVAEDDFDLNGRKLRAGALIIPNADHAKLDPMVKDLGLSGWAVSSAPSVPTHEMKLPRIGYVHTWQTTQDEGWTRAALDYYGIPYTYFADQKLRDGNLRARYDVILFPNAGNAQQLLAGVPKVGNTPLPYKKTDATPNLSTLDQSDDIRGGMGMEGLQELTRFVQEGGTLISDGLTAGMFAEYNMGGGVTVEHPEKLWVHGSVLRSRVTDPKSPLAYGYDSGKDLPIYFSMAPVFNTAPRAAVAYGGDAGGPSMNTTIYADPLKVSPLEPGGYAGPPAPPPGGGRGPGLVAGERPRAIIQFAANPNDLLLSGSLQGGEALSNRAALVDVPFGKGHMVLFATRPFWRWQTLGEYFLAFNAILNWDHLDAGKTAAPAPAGGRGTRGQ